VGAPAISRVAGGVDDGGVCADVLESRGEGGVVGGGLAAGVGEVVVGELVGGGVVSGGRVVVVAGSASAL
jgi:hypothetical protein